MAGNTFKARLDPSGREFSLESGDSILNCALRQRILLQYGCRNGRCSSCKYFLIDGEVDFGKTSPYCLTDNEKDEGWALLCQARALSDLVIRDQDTSDRDDAPIITPQNSTAVVAAIDQLSTSLWRLELDLNSPISFYPGQYIEVAVPALRDAAVPGHPPTSSRTTSTSHSGQNLEGAIAGQQNNWRCYSIASSPAAASLQTSHGPSPNIIPTVSPGSQPNTSSLAGIGLPGDPNRIELIVKRIAGGAFSDQIDRLPRGFELAIRGPYGMSYLRDGRRPVLLVATGSGIAPLLSMLRYFAAENLDRPIRLFYGARRRSDLIFSSEILNSEKRLTDFSFRPTLSAPADGDQWTGAIGRVTQVLQREVLDASPYDAYICGQPEMCESVATLLLAKGIPEHRIFRDDFFAGA